jgi:hypothetical protein
VRGAWLLLALVGACRLEVDIGGDELGIDNDGDGFSENDGDCDDALGDVAPGLPEACDGLDNDCDGSVDGLACSRSEQFTSIPKIDLLIVVDNSLTMGAEQVQIAVSIPDIITDLVQPIHDIHVGVISTDMDDPQQSGRLIPYDEQLWIDGETGVDEATVWLAGAVELGTSGAPVEQARAAVMACLAEHGDGVNAGFRRGDAHLAVLLFSDEDDSSEVPDVPDFLSWLDVEVGLEKVQVHGIVGVDQTPTCGEAVGFEHLDLIQATQGTSLSICEPDFGPFLVSLAQNMITDALPHRFALREAAEPGSVVVEIAAGTFLNVLSEDAFVYDVSTATVVIDGQGPPAGARVTIHYTALP